MANPITITPSSVADPDGCLPGTRQGMIDFVAANLIAIFGSGGSTFTFPIVGPTTPTPEQQTYPWLKTELSGRPIGWFLFYNGAWTRTGFVPYSELYYEGPSSIFDGSGKGIPGTQGEGFRLCNGNNGTRDLSDRFIVGSKKYSANTWVTSVEPDRPDVVAGGDSTVKLLLKNLPEIPLRLPLGGGTTGSLTRFNYGDANTSGGLYQGTVANTGDGSGGSDLSPAVPHQNVPPYYARAIIMFVP